MNILSKLEKLSDGPVRFSAVQSDDPSALLNQFQRHASASGKAMYSWRIEIGLTPLGIKPVIIPNTHSLEATLHYIADSRHYGIYLLCGVTEELDHPRSIQILQRIRNRRPSPECHVIILDRELNIPIEIQTEFTVVRHKPQSEAARRLRYARRLK